MAPERLFEPGRHRAQADARAILAYLATERFAYSLTRVSHMLQRNPATLFNAIRRLKERLPTEPALAEEIQHLAGLPDSSSSLVGESLAGTFKVLSDK